MLPFTVRAQALPFVVFENLDFENLDFEATSNVDDWENPGDFFRDSYVGYYWPHELG